MPNSTSENATSYRLNAWVKDLKTSLPISTRVQDVEEKIAFAAKYKRMEEALNKIASWEEGEVASGSFDEPAAAGEAREALAYDPLSSSTDAQ